MKWFNKLSNDQLINEMERQKIYLKNYLANKDRTKCCKILDFCCGLPGQATRRLRAMSAGHFLWASKNRLNASMTESTICPKTLLKKIILS